jgi:hypothetical protein
MDVIENDAFCPAQIVTSDGLVTDTDVSCSSLECQS